MNAARSGAGVRADAARVVDAVVTEGRSLDPALTEAAGRTRPPDRPLLRMLCYGTLRDHWRLRAEVDALLDKPLRRGDSVIGSLLAVGLYQLSDSRVPDHAAVSLTVEAARLLRRPKYTGLVNAVLRNFRRRGALNSEPANDEVRFNHPAWLIARLKADWQDHWERILGANNARAPMWLRVNRTRVSTDGYRALLAADSPPELAASAAASEFGNSGHPPNSGNSGQPPTLPGELGRELGTPTESATNSATNSGQPSNSAGEIAPGEFGTFLDQAIRLEEPRPAALLPGFAEGLVSVQDAAAQLAAPWLLEGGGTNILDACAAPGGKTAHLLELSSGGCSLTAVDKNPERLAAAASRLERLGLTATLKVGDATKPDAWWDGKPFDRILLDAPCSATGVVRRHPDIKLLRREADIARFAATQHELLAALWPLLAPAGRLLYVTCSVIDEENASVIGDFLRSEASAGERRMLSNYNIRDLMHRRAYGYQVLPGERGLDGFYYACLEKTV